MRRLPAVLLYVLLACVPAAAPPAAEFRVSTVTEDAQGRFRFEPSLLWIAPGDTVRFEPDNHLHATKAIPGMLPEGASPWWSRMGEPTVVRFEVPGVYGFKCPSHYGMGMVGLIVVGDPAPNLGAARRVSHPPAAARAFAELFARLEAGKGAAGGSQTGSDSVRNGSSGP